MLVAQIAHELKNYNLYLSFANYCAIEGFADLEEYFKKRAGEELNHHKWIFDYLTEGDYSFMYPLIEKNTQSPTDIVSLFTLTLDREIETTQLIYRIYEAALEEKDYMTASWLFEKLIKEQIEEENVSRMAISIMESDSSCMYEKAEQILNTLP